VFGREAVGREGGGRKGERGWKGGIFERMKLLTYVCEI